MSDQSANADPFVEQQLVAYLDGELDAGASRRIEEMLATDPRLREHLQCLDHTWELLDELDTSQVAEQFTHSTLEMVASAAVEEAEHSRREAPRRRRRKWLLAGGGLATAAAAGFLAVALLRPDPNRQLLRDLPVLERLDQYREIDDLGFLRALRDEGLFAEEQNDAKQ